MKNLKKVLALVVALTMVLGTVAFAGYTDVSEDAGEYTAVSTLSSLDILKGYEDGSFKPDGDITRAEFCAVVCRALGAKVSGSAVTAFSDVPADHWASAYIAYVAGLGIVNGMGDGTFAPDANVTFEQAVKMLVVALGYEPMAAQKGGYPTGYMVVANTYDITEGISAVQSAPASRGVVAELVYNALDVPVMEQVGFGTQISYEIMSPEYDNAYKALITGLGVAKLDGSVNKTEFIDGAEAGTVSFRIREANDNKHFEEILGDLAYVDYTFKVAEGVNAAAYFGYAAVVYAKEYAKNKYEIIAIMPGAEGTVVELGLEDIKTIDATKVEYYTDADHFNTKKYTLDASVNSSAAYYNYVKQANIDTLKSKYTTNDDVEFTLIENTGDNKFDMIIAKKYTYNRVKTVEADKGRFVGNTKQFVFDFENENTSISIVDENGAPMDLADFKKDDVIAFISDNNNGRNYTWIEVINLGQKTVSGLVTERSNDQKLVGIDNTEYGNVTPLNTIKLGDEGTFFLTRTGKIFSFEKSASVAGNYGYILGTAISNNGGWDDAWQVKMLTKDNEVVTYTVRDDFDVIINSGGTLVTIPDIDQADSSATLLSSLRIENFVGSDGAFKQSFPRDRIVTYKLDANGLIKEIAAPKYVSTVIPDSEYNADTEKLFAAFEPDAVIFNLAGNKETSAFVTDASSLVDENKYTGFYVKNDLDEVDCLIITEGAAAVDYTQDLAVVVGVTETKVGEEDAKKVRYYVSSENKIEEIFIIDDVSEAAHGTSSSMVKAGALMMFTVDSDKVASAYAVLANTNFDAVATSSAHVPYIMNSTLETHIEAPEHNLDTKIEVGYIEDTKEVAKGTKVTDGSGNELVIGASANTYTIFDEEEGRFKVAVGDWMAIGSDVDTCKGRDDGTANYFIAKVIDGEVVDFITFSRPFAVTAHSHN